MNTANPQQQIIGTNQGQQVQQGQDLLISPLTKISDGTKVSMTNLTNLLNKFKTIPQEIKGLRNKGTGEVTALQKQLSEAKTTLAKDNSDYVNGLVTRINSINTTLDGLKSNINNLGSKADEITNALSQANDSTAGGTTSPRSVATAPGVGQQSNIPLLSSSPSTTVPGYNKTVKQLHDQLGGIISTMQRQRREASAYSKYTVAKANLAKATSIQQIQQALSSVSKVSNNGQNVIYGGKRSRKIRRKYSKKHSKKLRRSSK